MQTRGRYPNDCQKNTRKRVTRILEKLTINCGICPAEECGGNRKGILIIKGKQNKKIGKRSVKLTKKKELIIAKTKSPDKLRNATEGANTTTT